MNSDTSKSNFERVVFESFLYKYYKENRLIYYNTLDIMICLIIYNNILILTCYCYSFEMTRILRFSYAIFNLNNSISTGRKSECYIKN